MASNKEYGVGNKFIIDSDFDKGEYASATPGEPEHSKEPEVRLWVAVLGQMIEDATLPRSKAANWAPTAITNSNHARAQIFAAFGTTAEDFVIVCDLAGFDPSFVRRCVSAAIERSIQVTREAFTKIALEDTPSEND